MFESVGDLAGLIDPAEWEPIPAAVLESIGAWDVPDTPGGDVPIPAGLDELIHEAQCSPIGPQTLQALLATPPELLSDEGRSLGLALLSNLSRSIDALRAEFTAVIAGPRPTSVRDRQDDFAAHEIAVATNCSVYAADRQISLARDLADRLRATATAMARGDVSLAQATALSEATGHMTRDLARTIETKVLRFAHRQDLSLYKSALRRWVARLDPDFAERATAARAEVEVSHTAFDDGTGQIYVRGPLEITSTIHTALTGYAAKTKDSLGGTVDQRRLAGLRDWAEVAWDAPDAVTHHGRRPTVDVVIELATLLGLNDHPADIPGVGPVPADAARWLVADGAPLRRLVIDPTTGHLLDFGTTIDTVPPALGDFLIAKNSRSAAPHSNVSSRIADMEHNTPCDKGGATDRLNCTPVDRRWHRAKTHGGWRYTKNPDDGVVTWTSPTGLTAQIDPYDYRAGP